MAVWDGKWNFERKNEILSKDMKLLGHKIKLKGQNVYWDKK